jgi:iron complex transport system ATP-binding protein
VTEAAIRVRDVQAGYRNVRGRGRVLHGVSATVRGGGWLAVVGPNGSGKSTLLKVILGLLPYSGEVLLDGADASRLDRRERARLLGYAPQVPVLPDGLSVTDYALLGRTPHLPALGREGRVDTEIVASVLAQLDLVDLAGRPLVTLSGGERQRAVLARALAQRAGILLLDEPTTGLDVGHAQQLLERLDRLREQVGVTVITTLHDLTSAAQYAEQVLLLDGGRVVADGAPAAVLTPERVARHYGGTVEVLRTTSGALAVVPVRPPSTR